MRKPDNPIMELALIAAHRRARKEYEYLEKTDHPEYFKIIDFLKTHTEDISNDESTPSNPGVN